MRWQQEYTTHASDGDSRDISLVPLCLSQLALEGYLSSCKHNPTSHRGEGIDFCFELELKRKLSHRQMTNTSTRSRLDAPRHQLLYFTSHALLTDDPFFEGPRLKKASN